MTLHEAQAAALQHVGSLARARRDRAREVIGEISRMSNLSAEALDRAVAAIKTHARIALHFHPDRPDSDGKPIAQSLLECGTYKNQFETRLSNGSVSAFVGGARDQWERKMFGGAYHGAGVSEAQRPKYGALDLLRHADGPAPRFGSCYFVLKPALAQRATFTYLDSHLDPAEKGTLAEFDDILAALLSECFTRDFALGEAALSPRRLLDEYLLQLERPYLDPANRAPARNLNHYIEAQLHGDIRLQDDVERLVADPSFQSTEIGRTLEAIGARYGLGVVWHAGFVLAAADVPDDFRGPTMPSLAARVAVDGQLDAQRIGQAVSALKRTPAAWSDRGSEAEVLQELKLLWHVLVRHGQPRASPRPAV